MKKILLLIALFGSLFASAQIPGYTFLNEKIERNDNIFRALGLPGGDSAQFRVGQARRQGAIYWDSTDNNTPKGLYIYDGTAWILQGQSGSILQPDAILFGGSVTPEGGFRFSVQEAIARIDNILYTSDSGTALVDSADATYDRFDVIYIDATGFHVLEGIPAENPAIPQLQGGQILLTVVSIEAGAIGANISTINVYFENDATITPSGTTAVGNSTTAPYAGTYHIRITNINNGDIVYVIKLSGTFDIAGQDFLSFHIKNLAQVPQLANLRVSLGTGSCTGCQVSSEVILNYNKNNSSTYQALSIPMAAFGNITNTNIDRLILRYTSNNANVFAGYDIDNVFFGDNMQQPGTGNFNATLNMPSAFTVSPSNTIQNNGIWNVTANGSSAQYIRGDGSLATFSAVTTVGAFGSQASNANGLFISGVNIYGQPVTDDDPGMVTPAMKESWDSLYTVEELSSLGYSIMVPIDAARTGFKRIVFDDVYKNTDTTIHLDTTVGGGGSGRFGYPGEDNTQAEERIFNTSGDQFLIRGQSPIEFRSGDASIDSVGILLENQHIILRSREPLGAAATMDLSLDNITFDHYIGDYRFTNIPDSSAAGTHSMVVWNASDSRMYKMDLPTGGGGSQNFDEVLAEGGALTTDREVDLAGNTLEFEHGNFYHNIDNGQLFYVEHGTGNYLIYGSPSASYIRGQDSTGGGNEGIITVDADVDLGRFRLRALFNNGADEAQILGTAESGVTALTFQAATNTFMGAVGVTGITTLTGDLLTATDNTYDIGSAAASFQDAYLRILHLDGSTSGTPTIFSDALGNTLNATTLSGTGYLGSTMFAVERSDFTGSNVNTVQPVFSTGNDVWTLQASTTYEVEGFYWFTHGATSHDVGISFELAGGASVTSCTYYAIAQIVAAGTVSSAQTSKLITSTTNAPVNSAGANTTAIIYLKGQITMNAGGTVTPSYTMSAAPGGTVLTKAGSYIKFTPIGTNTVPSLGNVN